MPEAPAGFRARARHAVPLLFTRGFSRGRCYNRDMRRALLTVCALAVLGGGPAVLAGGPAGLGPGKKVYFWPMSYGFDHYLAEQAAAEGLFGVVVDPKLAQAVMTERIDARFVKAMDELFPLPEDEAEKKAREEAEKKEAETEGSTAIAGDGYLPERPPNQSVGQSRGTLFLVDVVSRRVLWSTYLKEFDPSPDMLHKQAGNVVEKFKKDSMPAVE